jgi:transcriptional regulator with XRE-family HTH domain
MSITLNQLGKNLARNTGMMAKEAGIDLKQLSDLSGVSLRTLYRIEKARKARKSYSPMFKTVAKLASLAGVSVDDYVQGHLEFK